MAVTLIFPVALCLTIKISRAIKQVYVLHRSYRSPTLLKVCTKNTLQRSTSAGQRKPHCYKGWSKQENEKCYYKKKWNVKADKSRFNTKAICHFHIYNRCNNKAISSWVKMPVILNNSCDMASLQPCQRIIMIKNSDDTYALLMSCKCESINVWTNAAECFFEQRYEQCSWVYQNWGIVVFM